MEDKTFSDYLASYRRNRAITHLILACLVAISLLVAIFWPPVFRSSSTILIEEQEIPSDLVRSTITSFAAQRLQTISQRVMTRSNLMAIVEKFNLYEKQRKKETNEEIIERMRKDISFETLSADVIDPRSGHPTKATIAFSLSFDGHDARLVQQIANEITSLYLEENLKMRTRQTAEASDFLGDEVKQIGAYANELEMKLARFKESHINELPEHKQNLLMNREKVDTELKEIEFQIRSLQERNSMLDYQLLQTPKQSSITTDSGQHILGPTEKLKALHSQALSLTALYSDKHPDVLSLRQQIEALEKEVGIVDDNPSDQQKHLKDYQTKRVQLSERYGSNHPDIAALDKKIASLEKSIANSAPLRGDQDKGLDKSADNPVYLNLSGQREVNNLELKALVKRRGELQEKKQEYENRMMSSPDVERQYISLLRDLENTNLRYRELKAKQMEAQIAEQLEKKSKGEHFSIVEPPTLPEKPIRPNRPLIIVLGLILSLGLSAGYVFLREAVDKTIRKSSHVTALVGIPPLALIPYVEDEERLNVSNLKRGHLLFVIAGGLLATLLVILLIHFFLLPLDVLWFRGLNKLDRMMP